MLINGIEKGKLM